MSLPDIGKIAEHQVQKARKAARGRTQKEFRRHFSRSDRRRLTKAQAKANLAEQGISRRNSRAFYAEWGRLMRQFPSGTLPGAR